jgi:hypothetical protein
VRMPHAYTGLYIRLRSQLILNSVYDIAQGICVLQDVSHCTSGLREKSRDQMSKARTEGFQTGARIQRRKKSFRKILLYCEEGDVRSVELSSPVGYTTFASIKVVEYIGKNLK